MEDRQMTPEEIRAYAREMLIKWWDFDPEDRTDGTMDLMNFVQAVQTYLWNTDDWRAVRHNTAGKLFEHLRKNVSDRPRFE